ncbi:unnamed protein product, partial [Mesorhabditis spiculigera]
MSPKTRIFFIALFVALVYGYTLRSRQSTTKTHLLNYDVEEDATFAKDQDSGPLLSENAKDALLLLCGSVVVLALVGWIWYANQRAKEARDNELRRRGSSGQIFIEWDEC